MAPGSPVEGPSPSDDLKHPEDGRDGRIEARGETGGSSAPGLAPSLAGAIFGPPEPKASADPLTPAELATLAPYGKTSAAIRAALESAYLPRRGSPLGSEILRGCQVLQDDGIESYACWLSGFTAEGEG